MATEEAKVVDAMPPPPAYYKIFSPDAAIGANLAGEGQGARAASASAASTSTGGGATGTAPNDFPLQPPRPPGPGETYKMFGMPYSSEPVAQELLPPEKMLIPAPGQAIDFRVELKRLLNSIMANYGQFMEMLVSSPSRAHEKLSDVETLFVNFHSLLNRYRAHQARHIILEHLRAQAEEYDAAMSALEAAMLQCASAQEEAVACLDIGASGAMENKAARSPMDVVGDVDESVEREEGVGVGGVGGANTIAMSGGGVAGKEVAAAGFGKGKLRAALPAGVESGNGR